MGRRGFVDETVAPMNHTARRPLRKKEWRRFLVYLTPGGNPPETQRRARSALASRLVKPAESSARGRGSEKLRGW
jgi:hypothetical protein